MEFLQDLFGTESLSETIYWTIAVGSSGILGVKALLALIGLDLDVDLDIDVGGDDITLSAVLTFLGLGGWAGVIFNKNTDFGEIGILLGALVTGFVGFAGMVVLINKLKKLETSGNIKLDNAIGKTAEVYLGIPASKSGEGQVQILIQDRLLVYDALTEGKEIKTGEKVLVYEVENGKLLVEPYENKPQLP